MKRAGRQADGTGDQAIMSFSREEGKLIEDYPRPAFEKPRQRPTRLAIRQDSDAR